MNRLFKIFHFSNQNCPESIWFEKSTNLTNYIEKLFKFEDTINFSEFAVGKAAKNPHGFFLNKVVGIIGKLRWYLFTSFPIKQQTWVWDCKKSISRFSFYFLHLETGMSILEWMYFACGDIHKFYWERQLLLGWS